MANEERQKYQKALMDLIGCRPVAYYPSLARKVGGVKAAIMLSQFLYWTGDAGVQKKDGWFYKSVEELECETGLKRFEQLTARRTLEKQGVISCELKRVPPVWYYKINQDRLGEIIASDEIQLTRNSLIENAETPKSINEKPRNQLMRNSLINYAETAESINEKLINFNKVPETTTKTTAETTTETTPPPPTPSNYSENEGGEGDQFFEETQNENSGEELKAINAQIQDLLLTLGVREGSIKEVIDSDWNEDEIFTLAQKIKKEFKAHPNFNPGAIFVTRFRAGEKPKNPQPFERKAYATTY